MKISEGADELAESGLWLSFALRRAGRASEAGQVIRGIPGDLAVQHRAAELSLLRLFRGDIGLDSIRLQAVQGGPENEALFMYGLGFVQLARGDTVGAAETLQQVLDLGNWPSRAFIAAEADLARIRLGRKPRR